MKKCTAVSLSGHSTRFKSPLSRFVEGPAGRSSSFTGAAPAASVFGKSMADLCAMSQNNLALFLVNFRDHAPKGTLSGFDVCMRTEAGRSAFCADLKSLITGVNGYALSQNIEIIDTFFVAFEHRGYAVSSSLREARISAEERVACVRFQTSLLESLRNFQRGDHWQYLKDLTGNGNLS